jgi:DNA-binding PadR family transcriptional regulator
MNDVELTILSLLAEAPRYGHELQQIIDERGLREWMTIGFASIYYLLNKLERQEMLASELRPDNSGMARKVYSLTDAGRGVLQTAVSDLLRQPRALGTGFELGLTNIDVLKPHQVYQTLSHHRGDLRQRLDSVEKAWERHQRDGDAPNHIHALYTHSLAIMQAELVWLDQFLEDWLKRHPGADTPQSSHSAATVIRRRPTPDPAKMIQRLRRPPKPE